MKRTLIAALLALATIATVELIADTCGIQPVKPVTPVGCKDLAASCQCDARGKNCKWVWQCIR